MVDEQSGKGKISLMATDPTEVFIGPTPHTFATEVTEPPHPAFSFVVGNAALQFANSMLELSACSVFSVAEGGVERGNTTPAVVFSVGSVPNIV